MHHKVNTQQVRMPIANNTHFEMPPVPFLRNNRRLVQIVRQLESVVQVFPPVKTLANDNEESDKSEREKESLPTLHLVLQPLRKFRQPFPLPDTHKPEPSIAATASPTSIPLFPLFSQRVSERSKVSPSGLERVGLVQQDERIPVNQRERERVDRSRCRVGGVSFCCRGKERFEREDAEFDIGRGGSGMPSRTLRSTSTFGGEEERGEKERPYRSTARSIPIVSTRSRVSRKPAVSATTIGYPWKSSESSRTSRVVPGISVTMAASLRAVVRDW